MKILIPTIDQWIGYQLTEYNVNEFKNFIERGGNGYDFHTYLIDDKLDCITFKWNPYGYDHAETIKMDVNQIFMYNEENLDNYDIINNFKEEWTII